jgi:hypothetical protein
MVRRVAARLDETLSSLLVIAITPDPAVLESSNATTNSNGCPYMWQMSSQSWYAGLIFTCCSYVANSMVFPCWSSAFHSSCCILRYNSIGAPRPCLMSLAVSGCSCAMPASPCACASIHAVGFVLAYSTSVSNVEMNHVRDRDTMRGCQQMPTHQGNPTKPVMCNGMIIIN